MARRSHNQHLEPLPDDLAFLRAVAAIEKRDSENRYSLSLGASAQDVAYQLGVQPASRLGNGAVKGSWSGTMVPGLRCAPRLRSLSKRGLLREHWGDRRIEWALTPEGKEVVDAG